MADWGISDATPDAFYQLLSNDPDPLIISLMGLSFSRVSKIKNSMNIGIPSRIKKAKNLSVVLPMIDSPEVWVNRRDRNIYLYGGKECCARLAKLLQEEGFVHNIITLDYLAEFIQKYPGMCDLVDYNNWESRKTPPPEIAPMNKILDNLFLGDAPSAFNYNMCNDEGITHIVNVAESIEKPQWISHENYLKEGLLDDSWNRNYYSTLSKMDTVADYIHDRIDNHKILVHCRAGISRSATAVIYYLMKYCDMKLYAALTMVKGKRHIIDPNSSFLISLVIYEMTMTGSLTCSLPDTDQYDYIIKEAKLAIKQCSSN